MDIFKGSAWNKMIVYDSKQHTKENYNKIRIFVAGIDLNTVFLEDDIRLSWTENGKYLSQALSYEAIMTFHLCNFLWIQDRFQIEKLWLGRKEVT